MARSVVCGGRKGERMKTTVQAPRMRVTLFDVINCL
jgi:hypothetical protein